MTSTSSLVHRLRELPRSERERELRAAVEAEFRRSLLMEDDDDLPLDASYWDLGLSSLGLMETKERLEAQLGQSMSATALFNHPTLRHLLDHLTGDVLPDLFGGAPASATPAGGGRRADEIDDVLGDVLDRLYGKETGS